MRIVLSPAAIDDLDALETGWRDQVGGALREYARDRVGSVKTLRGFRPQLLRLRSGDFRVLFRIVAGELHVYRVVNRRELERALKRQR